MGSNGDWISGQSFERRGSLYSGNRAEGWAMRVDSKRHERFCDGAAEQADGETLAWTRRGLDSFGFSKSGESPAVS